MNKDVPLQSLDKDCRVPRRKTSSTLTRSFFEFFNLGGSADPSVGKMLSANLRTTQMLPEVKEICCHFPFCQLQKLPVGVKAKGTLICRQATRNSQLRASITCMALQQNDFGRILRSVSVRHSTKIVEVERKYVRLKKGSCYLRSKVSVETGRPGC